MPPCRTIFIGDVHGCSQELEDLLTVVNPAVRDRLVFLGDLINKGPDSRAVLERVRGLGARVILGNHELALLTRLRDGLPLGKGLEAVCAQLGADLDAWVEWLATWPFFLETRSWLAVHAGILPGRHPRDTPGRILTNIRTYGGDAEDLQNPDNPPWYHAYTSKKPIVFGHWARRGLVVRPNAVGLDTGCVYGGKLSALIWPSRRLVHVPAREVYQPV